MREADRKRERLLKTRCVSAATNHSGNTPTITNAVKPVGGESKETKKIRDTNNTTSMLVVVITVSQHHPFKLSVSISYKDQYQCGVVIVRQ